MRDAAELRRQSALELPALIRLGLALVLAGLIAVPTAAAQTAGSTPGEAGLRAVSTFLPVDGQRLLPSEVVQAARADGRLAGVLARHPRATQTVYVAADRNWQVAFRAGGREIAQALVADANGTVTEAWTGIQVEWPMARGYRGAFGRRAAGLPIWLGGLLLFVLPFLRPPWRRLHLDLAVIAAFSVSFACFSAGDVRWSIPLAYPPLLYLLARMLLLARDRRPPAPLRLVGGTAWLPAAILFLVGFRVALQIVESNVIDVGYAGVIGADRLAHLDHLYGAFPADNPHGDTYGPLAYLAYVPFELVWPWHGTWDDLPAAHAAATAFDLACAAALWAVGRRRSSEHGLLLAYLWLACPFTLLVANSGANDALTGLLVLAAVATGGGALGAAAGLTKFAPLLLLPMLVRDRRAALGAAGVLAVSLGAVALLDGGLGDFWRRTVAFQADRDSPFSLWGLYGLGGAQVVAQAAVAGFAVAAARVEPRDRFALAAALLIAGQLVVDHWFYLYLAWVLPLLLVALLNRYDIGRSTGSIDSARPDEQRTSTALSQGSSVAVS